ncbi:MAG: SDR family oxidoreductase [Candidatus Aminicenantes bacterium]|nr:SDR family oxidoreductase [Candidatus Aminicenantes bacterium]
MNVLITGSSNGLGRCLARKFARDYGKIILHGRKEAQLTQFRDLLNEDYGTQADMVIGDIREEETLLALYTAAVRNKIDVLINNAGVYVYGDPTKTTLADMDSVITTNMIAPMRLTLLVYPIMVAKGKGLIVNINSLAGKTLNDKEAVYCASKHGLRGFMGSFRHEARKHGVDVLDVYLGAMQTEMMLGRPGYDGMMDPDEVADVIAGLCRDSYDSLRVNEIEIGRL